MAAFSGHREDGDELLGCCFSVAYSHVEERWWEKRGEDEFPLLSFWRRGFFPSALSSSATAVQGCPVILPLRCNCCAFETWRNKMLFSMSWGDGGDTLLLSTLPLSPPPSPLHYPSQTAGTPFRSGKTLPMQAGKNAPPSAPSHLLFIVCFLTFISNSFHWHMKSWQRRDRAREGTRDGERV